MKRLLPVLLVVCAPPAAHAALNPEADKKYQLEVVLKCGAHNWLGDHFRNDLRSDLAGILQDALGGMADVTVVDLRKAPAAEWKTLWKEFEARGFAALDAPHELDGVKTHFLRIDFVNGQYELQARQWDGATGLAGLLQTDRTADRALVTRLAGKMLAQEFGLIGTVEGTGDTVRVVFKGGALNAALERWVRKGDVFALVRIAQQSKGEARVEHGDRVPDSLLRVLDDPRGGAASAEVVYRPKIGQPNPLAAGGLGFRCIKLGTTVGPVRLRLVDDRGQPHTRTLQVRLHPDRFQQAESSEEEILNSDNGVFVSKRQYQQMAYARVVTGGTSIAKFPVEVYPDRFVTVEVGLDAKREQAGQMQFQVNELRRQYAETRLVATTAFKEINDLVTQTKYDEALKRATAGRTALEDDQRRLDAQLADLKKAAAGAQVSLASCEEESGRLATTMTRMNQRVGELDKALQEANDPTRLAQQKKLQDLSAKSLAQIDNNDYQGAIDTCKAILKEFGDQPAIKKRLAELETGWALKGSDHQKARDFFYREFPAIKTTADFAAKAPAARQHLRVLVGANDQFTLAKLRNTLPEVFNALLKEVQAAKNTDDPDKQAAYKKVTEDFDKFVQEVEAAAGKK